MSDEIQTPVYLTRYQLKRLNQQSNDDKVSTPRGKTVSKGKSIGSAKFSRRVEPLDKSNSKVVLADEISPDNCRLWNEQDNASLDKDLFRQSKGDIKEAYIEVANRLGVLTQKVSSELSENKLSKDEWLGFFLPKSI